MSRKDYRFFAVRVQDITDLTPSFRRFTFTGPDLADYGDPGFDQRVKLVFPTRTASLATMPSGDDWYTHWRQMAVDERPVIRTYTTRAVRRDPCEVDIDIVLHADGGPAARWAEKAIPGDELLILAPTVDHGVSLGVDFVPPAHTDAILLAGDETAAPAMAAILEDLPQEARGVVVLEVPDEDDVHYLPEHPGFTRHIAARNTEIGGGTPGHDENTRRGRHLESAVRSVVATLATTQPGHDVEEVDPDTQLLWEVPRSARGGAALKSAPLYAWLAGEAGSITQLRRHLVTDHGIDRRAVAFMGYWRLGKAEN